MSTGLERKLQKFLLLLEDLATESAGGTLILVEGKKDVETLRELKITGDVITVKASGKTFLDVLSEVEDRGKNEVILMMDFDKRGREWIKRLAEDLERMRVKPNLVFWKELSRLVGRDVKDIEGLSTYMETLKRKTGKDLFDE